ncbi:hypothetical protein GCM10023237_02700 [Streptomyces coeruleoprunus]
MTVEFTAQEKEERVGAFEDRPHAPGGPDVGPGVADSWREFGLLRAARYGHDVLAFLRKQAYQSLTDVSGRTRHHDHRHLPLVGSFARLLVS